MKTATIITEAPSLPGCIRQGETREKALPNIQEAIALHVEVLEERGEPMPERGSWEKFQQALSKILDVEPEDYDKP